MFLLLLGVSRGKLQVATGTFYLNYYYALPIMVLSALLPYANIVTLLLHTFFGIYIYIYIYIYTYTHVWIRCLISL